MLAIYKRELKSYFQSIIGWLFIAVTLFFVSLYFTLYNLISGYPYVAYAVSSVLFLFLVTVPVLTMRALAEEKRSKTDQLILTAPVSVGGIVLGKFLAMLTVFAIPVLIVCTYPLIMSRYGVVSMPESYLAIFAFFLYGMAAIAIGTWVSSLTESQVISAVISFFVLLIGYMMAGLCSLISETGNVLTKILGWFDMSTPFDEMMNGVMNLKSVVYFLCLTGLMLFLTVQSIQKRRYHVSSKTLSLSAYSVGGIALVTAIIVMVNLVVSEMPSAWTSVDLTKNKLYTLTEKTTTFVKGIQDDVTIYVLVGKNERDSLLGQTLDQYEELSKHVKVEYVDPSVNPTFYKNYTKSASLSSLIVTAGDRFKVVDYNDLYEYQYNYDNYYYTGSYDSEVTGYDGEGQITSALAYVLSDSLPKLYFTTGHGESTLSSTFTDSLKKENMEYETINLMDLDAVPEDAAALFIYAPNGDFSVDDAEKVRTYLDGGGNVVYVAGYSEKGTPNLDGLIGERGISMTKGMVVEQNTAQYYRNAYYLLPSVSSCDYTSGVYGQYYVFTPFARGLTWNSGMEDVEIEAFLRSSSESFAKATNSSNASMKMEEGDQAGPFGIGLRATKTSEDGTESTLIVFSCSQIFSDEINNMVAGANQMVFSNMVGTFAEHEVSVAIPVKSYELSNLTVTKSNVIFWGALTVIILPVACLIVGFVIWLRRRKK